MSNTILGFYALPHELLSNETCFGKEIEITILGMRGKICFPNIKDEIIPNEERNPILICPIEGESWWNEPRGNETEWGRVVSFPHYSAYISKIILKFDNITQEDVKNIYDNIYNWFNKFYKLKEIITEQSIYYSNTDITQTTPPIDFYKYNSELERLHIDGENHISMTVTVGNNGLSFEDYKKIIVCTNSPKQISFEYDKYRLAIEALDKKDYASVVVNGAVSIEKALITKIKETCTNKGVLFDKLSEKYRTLGGVFALAEALQIPLPTTDYKTKIINLRNKVVHDGYPPQKREAFEFLRETKTYLETYSNIIE